MQFSRRKQHILMILKSVLWDQNDDVNDFGLGYLHEIICCTNSRAFNSVGECHFLLAVLQSDNISDSRKYE